MEIDKINWNNKDLIPAIVQHSSSLNVLMLGYMNAESLERSIQTNEVTFFSRSKKRLWTKGEESGNKLIIKSMDLDCDNDTLLIKADPLGPTCHLGTNSCFKVNDNHDLKFILELEVIINKRKKYSNENSYVSELFKKGIKEIAKKVTEEAGETSISAVANDGRVVDESADLLFHLLILLNSQNLRLKDVVKELVKRNSSQ
jgi:phosphoribosyl-ATP pyrophosphohydrolase/phosphoribosyl-AMP cyclohydrolase